MTPEEQAELRDQLGEQKAAHYHKRADVYEQQIIAALRVLFEQQRQDVLANAAVVNLKGYGTHVTKADKKQYLSLLADWNQYNDAMKEALAPILYALIVETGQTAMSDLNLEASLFNAIEPQIIDYYQARATKIATDVNAETEKQLRAAISQGIEAGATDDELAASIEDVFGAALTYRADRIARTEVTRAQGYGDIRAWDQSGVVTGKEWYTVLDERTCVFCNSEDGTIVELDTNFYSLGDVVNVDGKTLNISYDDVASAPAHVSCRCVCLPVQIPLSSGEIDE